MRTFIAIILFNFFGLALFAQSKNSLFNSNVTHTHSVASYNDEPSSDKPISEISLSPNPTHGDSKLEFVTNRSGRVDISVLNTIGKKIDTFTCSKEFGVGKHFINLNTSELPQGIYFVEIVSGGVRSVHRLFVLAN